MSESYPAPIEQDGHDIVINVHDDGALALVPITLRDAGKIIAAAALTINFKVKAINFTKALGANPGDARGRGLSLTKAECAAIPDGARWAIWDDSDPANPVDQGKGIFRKYR